MAETTFDPIKSRQDEIAQYEQNIATYTAIAAATPSEWPERLEAYKGSKNKHEVIATIEDLADVELLSDLWANEEARAAIRTETLEKRKAEAILATLI
jgi:nuclear transport factor 2 (NTF2) superfamily protein